LQASLETVRTDISSKRKLAALDGVKNAKTILNGKSADAMIASCRDAKVCTEIVATMQQGLDPLTQEIKTSQEVFNGSEQEREALDKAYVLQQSLTKRLTALEEQMVPEGYETPVPAEYSDLPQLKKRATVEMVVQKADNGVFNVNGVNFPQAKLTMVIDGYTGMYYKKE
jgi:peptidylprolyl isomerase